MEQYAIGAFNLAIIIGLYLHVQSREDKQRERMQEMEKEITELRTNYRDRFEKMYDKVDEMERRVMEHTDKKLTEMEERVRTSYHKHSGDISKVLLSIQDKLTRIEERAA